MKLFHGKLLPQFFFGQLPQFDESLLANHIACNSGWCALVPRDVLGDQVAFVPRVLLIEVFSLFSSHFEIIHTSVEDRP